MTLLSRFTAAKKKFERFMGFRVKTYAKGVLSPEEEATQRAYLKTKHEYQLTRNEMMHAVRVNQAKAEKARLVREGRGKNGRSMSLELLALHGLKESDVQR